MSQMDGISHRHFSCHRLAYAVQSYIEVCMCVCESWTLRASQPKVPRLGLVLRDEARLVAGQLLIRY
jgi:hypothetical protein